LAITNEDPGRASVRLIVEEVMGRTAGSGSGGNTLKDVRSGNMIASPWISSAPITIKMRLFCLPYAGGVSENVFGRFGSLVAPTCDCYTQDTWKFHT